MESGWLLSPSSDLGQPCNGAMGCRTRDWVCPHITHAAHSGPATAPRPSQREEDWIQPFLLRSP